MLYLKLFFLKTRTEYVRLCFFDQKLHFFVNPQREYERKNAFASTVQTETMYILIFTTSRQALSVSFTDAYVW